MIVGIAKDRKSIPRLGIEPVDRADQTDRAGLFEVLERLTAATEAAGDVLHHGQVAGDDLVAQRVAVRIVGGQRGELRQRRGQMGVVLPVGRSSRHVEKYPASTALRKRGGRATQM